MKLALSVFAALFLVACQSDKPVKLVFPERIYQQVAWTDNELDQAIAIRLVYASPDTSAYLIRINGSETPHYHDRHDLKVSVLSGSGVIHFLDHDVALDPGDVVFIPKGTYHWAESTADAATVVFATFSPAFDGKDKRAAN